MPFFVYERKLKQKYPTVPNPYDRPTLQPPWYPVTYYRIPTVLISSVVIGMAFSGMFVMSVTLPEVVVLLPIFLTSFQVKCSIWLFPTCNWAVLSTLGSGGDDRVSNWRKGYRLLCCKI